MRVIKKVHIVIKGQVPDDYRDNDYEVLLKKLEVICAEYRLKLDDTIEIKI